MKANIILVATTVQKSAEKVKANIRLIATTVQKSTEKGVMQHIRLKSADQSQISMIQ